MATDRDPVGSTDLDDVVLGTQTVARIAAALFVVCGALVVGVSPVVPGSDEADGGAVLAIGGAAIGVGVVVWHLPWDRWTRWCTLWLVPVAFVAIGAFNIAAADPHLYPVFYLVVFAWIGIAHRPGTAIGFTPLLAAAYLTPTLVRSPVDDGLTTASLAFVLPVCAAMGETVAWGANRLRRAEAARARSEARYEALVRHANEIIAVLDDRGVIGYVSPNVERILGQRPDELTGRPATDLLHPDDLCATRRWFAGALEPGREHHLVLHRFRHADGSWRWVEGLLSDLRADPAVGGILLNGRDVTKRVEAESELAHAAYHDALTGLPNWSALTVEIERALEGARRRDGEVAVLFVDLDGFKVVNDTLGHEPGDRLLSAVADRLRTLGPDGRVMARRSGDEFVFLVAGDDATRTVEFADEILSAMTTPFSIDERRLVLTASIGIAVRPAGATTGARLLREADLALHRAKERGKNRWELFDDELERTAQRRLDTEAELRVALTDDQLVVYYQPEVELATMRTVGVEALVRWHHPDRGLLPPSEFIDIAEESGLIGQLGSWVLHAACRQGAAWSRTWGTNAPRVAVNVSVLQLQDDNMCAQVRDALERSGLPAHLLRLEVTETILADPIRATRTMHELASLGVQLAIDDFGTGYSSLGYLHRLPVDVVKIDQSFLAPITAANDRAPLVETVIALGERLDIDVVAEGVESVEQLSLLSRLGCRYAQGYLLGSPEPAELTERTLAAVRTGRTPPQISAFPVG